VHDFVRVPHNATFPKNLETKNVTYHYGDKYNADEDANDDAGNVSFLASTLSLGLGLHDSLARMCVTFVMCSVTIPRYLHNCRCGTADSCI